MKEKEASQYLSRVFIGIPSLGRMESITKKTLALVKDFGAEFKIFVEPHEAFYYKYYCGKKNVEVLPESGRGIGYSRNHMRKYAREHGYEFIFEMDDDMDGFERIDTLDKHEALTLTIVDIVDAMDRFPKMCGARFTQYRYWLYSKKDMHKWTHINKPLQGVTLLRLSAIPDVGYDFTHFEDTAISLLMFEQGYFSLNYGYSGLKVIQNAGKGGCNQGDRRQSAKNSIIAIQKLLPHVYETKGNSYFGVEMNIDYYKDLYKQECINLNSDDELERYLKNNR